MRDDYMISLTSDDTYKEKTIAFTHNYHTLLTLTESSPTHATVISQTV